MSIDHFKAALMIPDQVVYETAVSWLVADEQLIRVDGWGRSLDEHRARALLP